MTIAIKALFQDVVDVTTDTTQTRWAIDMLARHYNAGLRDLAVHRPDAFMVDGVIAKVAGVQQQLPAGATKLLDITNNIEAPSRSVTLVTRARLDASLPGWRGFPQKGETRHFMYDPREPLFFDVYPPSTAGTTLRARYAAMPTLMAVPTPDTALDAIAGNVPVGDIFVNALREYMLYRCFDMDAEGNSDPQRAAGHFTMFANLLGIELKATVAAGPKGKRAPGGTEQPADGN
jgi:hypothetical protein